MKKKRTAIISGASSGIGKAIAIKLAENDFNLCLNGRSKVKLESVIANLSLDKSIVTVGSVSDRKVCQEILDNTVKNFGGVDTVIINAGVGFFGSFLDTPQKLIEEIVYTNLIGSIFLAQISIPLLLRNNVSNLVFISSVAGFRGGANEAVYAATKYAQNGLAGSIDREFRKSGLRVTIIAPGSTQSTFGKGSGRESALEEQAHFLNPKDIAEAVFMAITMPEGARIQQISILPMVQQS